MTHHHNKQPMTQPTELPKTNLPEREARTDRNRRRLLQGGLGAAPLLTLVSRPVLGNGDGGQCVPPSSWGSLPHSKPGAPQYSCNGRTPDYWQQPHHSSSWPPSYSPSTVFNAVFSASPCPYPDATTLLDVLEMGGGPPNPLGRHIVASLLNVEKGWVSVLTVTSLQDIWLEYVMHGHFEPTAGVRWYHDEIVDYLASTMPL